MFPFNEFYTLLANACYLAGIQSAVHRLTDGHFVHARPWADLADVSFPLTCRVCLGITAISYPTCLAGAARRLVFSKAATAMIETPSGVTFWNKEHNNGLFSSDVMEAILVIQQNFQINFCFVHQHGSRAFCLLGLGKNQKHSVSTAFLKARGKMKW